MSSTKPAGLLDRFPALRRLQAHGAARRVPVIQQLSPTECGSACLAMVLDYFGRHVPLGEIRDVIGGTRDGVCASTLLKTAR